MLSRRLARGRYRLFVSATDAIGITESTPVGRNVLPVEYSGIAIERGASIQPLEVLLHRIADEPPYHNPSRRSTIQH